MHECLGNRSSERTWPTGSINSTKPFERIAKKSTEWITPKEISIRNKEKNTINSIFVSAKAQLA